MLSKIKSKDLGSFLNINTDFRFFSVLSSTIVSFFSLVRAVSGTYRYPLGSCFCLYIYINIDACVLEVVIQQ